MKHIASILLAFSIFGPVPSIIDDTPFGSVPRSDDYIGRYEEGGSSSTGDTEKSGIFGPVPKVSEYIPWEF